MFQNARPDADRTRGRWALGAAIITVSLTCLTTLGCSSDDPEATGTTGEQLRISSDEFVLEPGDEKYICYTQVADRPINFRKFSVAATPGVHHMFFARTLSPEPAEPFECDVLFKPNWLPLFTTGAGAATLELPPESSFEIEAGTQFLMQLHLLNGSQKTIREKVTVVADLAPPEAVRYRAALFPFGTTVFQLPAKAKSSVAHECTMHRDMEAFAVFPHMHQLGQTMTFEVGEPGGPLEKVFEGQWDFDNQRIDAADFSLRAGQFTRTTCHYDNPTDRTITYGESTLDEMCFFSIFIKDGESLDGHCVDIRGLGDPGGGTVSPLCDTVTANERGIGAPCHSERGGCAQGLACSSSLSGEGRDGICIEIGKCAQASDCGSGASCCAPAAAGGALNICVPEVCRPSDCSPR